MVEVQTTLVASRRNHLARLTAEQCPAVPQNFRFQPQSRRA
jgi:hypothetical protein